MDVAVVGAGPAGAWAAYRLARAGARVALFDASHPREKPCGGGVTGRALAMVADGIGASLTPADTVAIRAARFGLPRGSAASAGQGPSVSLANDALVAVSRRSFDAALVEAAQRAGATLIPARVLDVDARADGVTLRAVDATYHADFLIGADGVNSLVRRRLASPFRREQISIATGFYARGVTSDEIVIEFVADPPGYIWSFPRPDHLAVGICAQADAGVTSGQLRERVAHWLRDGGARAQALEPRRWEPYAWPIPSLRAADFAAPAAGSRWLLVGDAAGLVDPITREGIFFALQSAGHAAEALAASAAGRTYEAHLRDDVIPEIRRAAQLKAGFFTPPFVRLLLTALERSARIRAVMADLVAGRQSYRTLKWRLLNTFELRLAWDALKQC